MKRFGQVVIGALLATAWSAAPAQAQAVDGKWSLQVDAAATLGHSSSSSFGGELDRRLNPMWDVTFEVGRMANVTSSATEDRAGIIANSIGATATPVQSAVYYDFGLRYRLMPDGKWNPYIVLGFGGARLKTGTTFAIGGTQLTSDQLTAKNVALGADLDGTVMKPILVFGVGANVPIKQKYFFDGSVRYGRIFPRGGEIDGDKANNTIRVQLGLGIRF